MPNVKGPKESRRLYSAVAHSILLYAAPVWAEEIKTKKAKKELGKKTTEDTEIDKSKDNIGYRTVSYTVTFMLARVLPIELQADILKKLYIKKKAILNSRDENLTVLTRYHKVLIEDSINK